MKCELHEPTQIPYIDLQHNQVQSNYGISKLFQPPSALISSDLCSTMFSSAQQAANKRP